MVLGDKDNALGANLQTKSTLVSDIHLTLTDLEPPRNLIMDCWDSVLRLAVINYFEILEIYFPWLEQQ